MISETKAGIQYVDLHIGGTESAVIGLLAEKALDPVEPYFVLPEVKDPKQWWGGHMWVDNAKRFIYAFAAYQTVSLWYNPNEYKPAEFQSFDDLLNPKLQGKIGISDPRTPGFGQFDVVAHAFGQKRGVPKKAWLRRSFLSRGISACWARI